MCGDVGERILRPVFHEDADRGADSDAFRVQPACQGVGQVVHLSKGQRSTLPGEMRDVEEEQRRLTLVRIEECLRVGARELQRSRK